MQVCCPVCDTPFPIAAGFAEADGKRLATLLAEFEPALGRASIAYLALFKPAKTQLRMARAVKLLAELKALVDASSVCKDERSGVRRPAGPAQWIAGIEQMLQQRAALTLPLDNHNYLRSVVYGIADKIDAAAEKKREEDARAGRRIDPSSAGGKPDALADELAWIDQQERYEQLTPEEAAQRRANARAKHGANP